jgi:hypothetical protein
MCCLFPSCGLPPKNGRQRLVAWPLERLIQYIALAIQNVSEFGKKKIKNDFEGEQGKI